MGPVGLDSSHALPSKHITATRKRIRDIATGGSNLDTNRPCALPTYSRSTLLRVTLLIAGFFVGVGHATGEKEETTVAANTMSLVAEPLDRRWLERVRRSSSAEPLWEPVYRQAPLSPETWQKLREHPQLS